MSKNRKVRISNSSLNCYGTRVLTEGVDLQQYERNPILLWAHKRWEHAIGRVENIRKEGDDVVGELVFDGIGELSKMVEQKWDAGTYRMVSGNFDIIELSDDVQHILPGQRHATVTKSKMIEVSVVDIGGNDDALVLLTRQGKTLELSKDGTNSDLPLINNHKKTKKMDFKAIALKLGLDEAASEQQILDTISLLLSYKTTNDTLTAENTQLKANQETLTLAGITTMVEGAIASRKIVEDKKSEFIELGKKIGSEALAIMLSNMHAPGSIKPSGIIGAASGQISLAGADKWTKLSEVPADKLMELRDNDKATYIKLYKAEYGIECKL